MNEEKGAVKPRREDAYRESGRELRRYIDSLRHKIPALDRQRRESGLEEEFVRLRKLEGHLEAAKEELVRVKTHED